MKSNYPSETTEQIMFLEWCNAEGISVAATPNETPSGHMENGKWKTHWKSAKEAKAKGASAGFPDLTIICPCGDNEKRIIFIEMKSQEKKPKKEMDVFDPQNWQNKDGSIKKSCAGVTRAQINWMMRLNQAKESGAFVCYSALEAIRLIKEFRDQIDF